MNCPCDKNGCENDATIHIMGFEQGVLCCSEHEEAGKALFSSCIIHNFPPEEASNHAVGVGLCS